jgi:transcriptional regulator with XRE-family HTH domain
MKEKSLRQIGRELGVSHSYLSQVLNGKRHASEKIAYKLCKEGLLIVNGKQMVSKSVLLENTPKIPYNDSISGCNSAVECLLPKQDVTGSNPATRSTNPDRCLVLPLFPRSLTRFEITARTAGLKHAALPISTVISG